MLLNLNEKIVSFEQLVVFLNVIEEGSFLGASKKLSRAHGAISYHINTMENLLGFKLFDRSERRPTLTSEGKAFEIEAKKVLGQMQSLLSLSEGISKGLEASLSITIDSIFPVIDVIHLLSEFKKRFPTVHLNLRTGILSKCVDDLLERRSNLAVVGDRNLPDELNSYPSGTIQLVPVASPSHPLAKIKSINDDELGHHVQILLSDDKTKDRKETPLKTNKNIWRVNDVHIRNQLLEAGFGWSRVPHHYVSDQIKSGKLVKLLSKQWGKQELRIPIKYAYRKGEYVGPAMNWWMDNLNKFSGRVW